MILNVMEYYDGRVKPTTIENDVIIIKEFKNNIWIIGDDETYAFHKDNPITLELEFKK